MPDDDTPRDANPADPVRALVANARHEIHKVIHGNDDAITLLLVALAAKGHILVEGIPGVGKTTLAKTFARVTGLDFGRVQMTPDMMPADVTGHTYYDQANGRFEIRKGPVFTNVLLADELNRTPPRTQAALLEAMQELQVTIEGTTLPLPDPFLVLATKNPIEVEGVYPLPEAELDRFMVSLDLTYPERSLETAMLLGKVAGPSPPQPLQGIAGTLQEAATHVRIHDDLIGYLLDVVDATRDSQLLDVGASPRGSEHLLQAARAHAALLGRRFVVPDDIKRMAPHVLGHRLILSADAEVEGLQGRDIVRQILDDTKVPIREGPSHG